MSCIALKPELIGFELEFFENIRGIKYSASIAVYIFWEGDSYHRYMTCQTSKKLGIKIQTIWKLLRWHLLEGRIIDSKMYPFKLK